MGREGGRVLVYAVIFLLVYWAYRNGSIQGGKPVRIVDALSGAPVTPEGLNTLQDIRVYLAPGQVIQ